MLTAAALAGTVAWGSAIEVPGTAALNDQGYARVDSVSCASTGNCAAGGLYTDGSGFHGSVVSEQGGVWGTAIEVPGLSAGVSVVWSVSCAGAGDCAAGGWTAVDGSAEAFVADDANGVWGAATKVPGLAELDVEFGDTGVTSVSCGSPGNCAAVGFYAAHTDKYGGPIDDGAFVVSEKNGQWGMAHPVPGVASVSCVGVGDCVAGGGAPNGQAFVVSARNGSWGESTKVPGLGALDAGGGSHVTSVSCASPGSCVAGGAYRYTPLGRRAHSFVVAETNGKWGDAIEVLGGPRPRRGSSWLASVSCASVGDCAAGGWYYVGTGRAQRTQAYVAAERNGTWRATTVPGIVALNVGGYAQVASVSCASAGNCAATGYYTDRYHKRQAFVVAERGGVWGSAIEVPGTAALNAGGNALPSSVSCSRTGKCAVGGDYLDGSGHFQAFVTAP